MTQAEDIQSLIGRRYSPIEIVREQRSGWKVGIIPSFIGGINDKLPADLIKDSESPYLKNLSFLGGMLKVDTGYIKFGSLLDDVPKGIFEHKQADGVSTRLCVTNKTVYKYNVTDEEWHVISGGVTTTLAADMSDTDTQATVASDANFTVGSVFAVALNTGKQMIREVATLPGGNVITFTPAAGGTPGVVATSGNDVLQGAELSGDDDNQVVFAAVPSNEWTAFTNGVNPPYRYEASADTVVTLASLSGATLAATTVCKTLAMFKSALCLINLIEAATYRSYKMQWCDPGDPTDWTGGNSGNNSLLDSRDAIIAAKPIGSSLALYRSNSIVLMNYQGGAGNFFFRFDTSVYGEVAGTQGVGAVSPNAVFALPDEAVVMTSDGIYLYRGGFNIPLISGDVFNGTFGAQGDMDGENTGQNFLHFLDRTNEVFCFYRSTSSTYGFPDRALVLDLATRKFRKRFFRDGITCAGDTSTSPTVVTINDLIGTIDEQAWLLGGGAAATGIGTVLIGTVVASHVMEYNYMTPEDDGFRINWEMHTKDIDGVDHELTLDWIEFEMGAIQAYILYSMDSGQNWKYIGYVGDTNILPRRMSISKTARKFRFLVLGYGGGGSIGKMALRFKDSYAVL